MPIQNDVKKSNDEKYVEEKAKDIVAWVYRITETEPNLEIHVFNLRAAENIIYQIIKDHKPKVGEKEIADFHNNLMTIQSDSLNEEESYHREIDYMHRWLVLKGVKVTDK